jgi:choline dehydrogenase
VQGPAVVTNGNIYAPVMMIAEKAADLILGNTPLAAQPARFYRHGAGMPLDPEPAPGSGADRSRFTRPVT